MSKGNEHLDSDPNLDGTGDGSEGSSGDEDLFSFDEGGDGGSGGYQEEGETEETSASAEVVGDGEVGEEEEVGGDDEEYSIKDLARIIVNQQAQIASLYETRGRQDQQPPADTTPPFKVDTISFINSEEELADVFRTADGLNKILNRVHEQSVRLGREMALREVPSVASKSQEEMAARQRYTAEFYDANPDLLPFKEYVGFEAAQLRAKNPSMDVQTFSRNVAKTVRQKLKLPALTGKGAPAAENGRDPRASAQAHIRPNGGVRRPPAQRKVSEAEQDALDIISG